MYRYSNKSLQKLNTCHWDIQRVFLAVIGLDLIDITIVEGWRSKARQNRLYAIGKSKLKWPHSKHNTRGPAFPSMAVDAAPCILGKVSWDWRHCIYSAGIIMGVAAKMGIKLRWGGDWDCDGEAITDQTFQDLVHFEIAGVS